MLVIKFMPQQLKVLSTVDLLKRQLGNTQEQIRIERQWIVSTNWYPKYDDDSFVATFPTRRFNRLYNEAVELAEKISRLTI